MRQINIKGFFSFLSILLLSSCLKEARMNIDPSSGTANIIEFANTGDNGAVATSKYPSFYTDLKSLAIGQSGDININVSYSGANTAPQDITVNLALDPTILTLYNSENGTKYVVPPTSVYTIPTTVVIKQGTRMTQVKAAITRNNSYDFNASYALPLKITSASTGVISGNFGAALYSFSARNSYDGVYAVSSGTVTRYTAPGSPANDALSGTLAGNPNVSLSTVGPNTVELSGLQWARKGGGVGGINNLQATIDPATNLVTMKALGNATLTNMQGKVNKYDPATKTFTLAFIWNPTAAARTYEVVLTYKEPR
jgi:hypothetical protein